MEMFPKKTDSPLDNFTISPLHHNDFTISPYVRKILINHYSLLALRLDGGGIGQVLILGWY